jgi:hypothetical protein
MSLQQEAEALRARGIPFWTPDGYVGGAFRAQRIASSHLLMGSLSSSGPVFPIPVIGAVATGRYRRHREIAIRYASLYRSHGGGELRYIPALNDLPGHIKALASLLRRHLRGWAPGLRIS